MEPSERPALLVTLGARVRVKRRARGWTLKELAVGSGLSQRFVAELEAGRANISVLKLQQVSQALGVQAAELLTGVTANPSGKGVVALLGLRGAGKSTIGAGLARRLGAPFFELDGLVEKGAGMGLAEIFAIHGEDYFRRAELQALQRVIAEHPRAVLATGGGIVTSPAALGVLRDRCRTVWLKATPEDHWRRVVEQGDLRPMENRPHAMADLRRRLKEREPLYGQAELTCVTSGRSVQAVLGELGKKLQQFGSLSAEPVLTKGR